MDHSPYYDIEQVYALNGAEEHAIYRDDISITPLTTPPMVRRGVEGRYRDQLLMNIHLLFRRERIAELVSVLTPGDTVILMEEALADDFCTATGQLRCHD